MFTIETRAKFRNTQLPNGHVAICHGGCELHESKVIMPADESSKLARDYYPPCEREIDSNGAFFKVSRRVTREMSARRARRTMNRRQLIASNKFRRIDVDKRPRDPMEIMQLHRSVASWFYDRLQRTKQWSHYLLARFSVHYARRIC